MRFLSLLAVALVAMAQSGSVAQSVPDHHIRVNQLDYRTSDPKLAVAFAREPLPADPRPPALHVGERDGRQGPLPEGREQVLAEDVPIGVERAGLEVDELRAAVLAVEQSAAAGGTELAEHLRTGRRRAAVHVHDAAHAHRRGRERHRHAEGAGALFLAFRAMADVHGCRLGGDFIAHRAALAAAGSHQALRQPPPPKRGRVGEGEAGARWEEAFARFPHPTLPHVGGGGSAS